MYMWLIVLLCLFLSGCARVLNPYDSEFSCPQVEKGKCVGIPQAYEESLRGNKVNKEFKVDKKMLLNDRAFDVSLDTYGKNTQESQESKEFNLAREAFSDQKKSVSRDELLLSPAERHYVESLYDVLTKLLKDPQAPVIMPPKIVRVLILPYQNQDGKHLYSARYVYVLVEDPKWILHNILTSDSIPEE